MLDEQQIRELVTEYGVTVSQGRPIKQIIEDGDISRLSGAVVIEGKVSDSVFREDLVTKSGQPIRLMFRNNRISTHDVNRGAIPFKDQVLACNHDHMLRLIKDVLGSSQFEVEGLLPSSFHMWAARSQPYSQAEGQPPQRLFRSPSCKCGGRTRWKSVAHQPSRRGGGSQG